MTLFWWTSWPTKMNEHGWISPRNLPVFPGKIPQVSCVTHDEAATLARKRWELEEQLPGKMRKWENFQILMRLPKRASTLSLQEYPWFTKQSWWDYPSQPIKLRLRSLRKMRILFCLKKMHGAVKRWNLLVKKIESTKISQVSFRDHCTPVGWVTFWWWNTSQLLAGVVVLALRGSL